MGRISKDHAQIIAGKLEAVIVAGASHDLAQIYYKGKRIAQFGIRRGSKRDAPHDYIAGQLHLARRDCEQMVRRLIGREEWLGMMKEKGII